MPSSFAARRMRRAISPRLAIRIFSNISASQAITSKGWPYSTGWAVLDQMAVMSPALWATMSLKVFIASTSSTFWPAETCVPISTKALASGLGPQIDRADHRRFQDVGVVRGAAADAAGADEGGRGMRGRPERAPAMDEGGGRRHDRRLPRHADPQVALFHLDFGEVGLAQHIAISRTSSGVDLLAGGRAGLSAAAGFGAAELVLLMKFEGLVSAGRKGTVRVRWRGSTARMARFKGPPIELLAGHWKAFEPGPALFKPRSAQFSGWP